VAGASAVPAEPGNGRPPQYVIISFDGAHDVAQWKRSRALAEKTGAVFTYFLSCVFLLSRETRDRYQAPGRSAGRSNVGFALSREEVHERLDQIWSAHLEGHEIASHGCGHYDGGAWSKTDWLREFSSFSTILRDAYSINGIKPEPEGWRRFAEAEVKGFRAPYLSAGKTLGAALSEDKFAYNASGVSRHPIEPSDRDGVVEFALPQIPEGPAARRVLGMDYNLFVRHSGGFETRGRAKEFEDRAYAAFLGAFEAEYNGKRAPLQLGFHFTLMNGGAYWRALERFAQEACIEPDVACVSYRDYLARTRPAAARTAPGATAGG